MIVSECLKFKNCVDRLQTGGGMNLCLTCQYAVKVTKKGITKIYCNCRFCDIYGEESTNKEIAECEDFEE